MTRPRRLSNKEILETARQVFLEQGASVSTTTIAERAGVSQAVLFQRFGTKERMLMAALSPPELVPWAERAEAGPNEGDIRAQLRELAGEILTHFEQIVPAMTVLRAAGYCAHDFFESYEVPPPLRGHRCMKTWFEKAVARGRISPVDCSSVAMAFVGSLQAWVFYKHIVGDGSVPAERETYLDWLVKFYWSSLKPMEER